MPPPPKEKKEKDPNAPSFKDRLFFGGTFWIQFWGSYKYLELSPLVGYAVTPNFLAGAASLTGMLIMMQLVEMFLTTNMGTDSLDGILLFPRSSPMQSLNP